MAPDSYLRVNYPPNPSPMCSNSSMNVNSVASGSNDSQNAPEQQGKQQLPPTPLQQQQQQQPVQSPYAVPGTPHSVEQQYHQRQHPSPYQAPQQSPAATNSMPVSTAVGGQYHPPPATQGYPMSEMNRYASIILFVEDDG